MIYYHPSDGDVYSTTIKHRPRTCFLMTKLGQPIPRVAQKVRSEVEKIFDENGIDCIDADSITTGKDYLFKIWQLIISVPIGVAIIYEDMPYQTMANIFYELGLMHAYGKETIIIKTGKISIPSDFIRTEYVEYDDDFARHFCGFIDSLQERADHYVLLSEELEKNPLLSIDYIRRAYLLTGDENLQKKASQIYKTCNLQDRAKNSVESLLVRF